MLDRGVLATVVMTVASPATAGGGSLATTGTGSGETGGAYATYAAFTGSAGADRPLADARDQRAPGRRHALAGLRTESKKWETAYDEFVRGVKGTGN
jgi:hypothetical protein